jgi:hypothetical protein
VSEFDPGCNFGPTANVGFKQHALLHSVSGHVINPCGTLRRCAQGYNALHSGALRFHDVEVHAAACRPGYALPSHTRSVEFRKPRPVPAVSEDFPGHVALGPGEDGMVDPDDVGEGVRDRQLLGQARLGPR